VSETQSSNETISPAPGPLSGTIRLPGDKSISHRYAMLAAIAEGTSVIRNYSSGADCQSTLGAVGALGIGVARDGRTVTVHGQGLDGLRAPAGRTYRTRTSNTQAIAYLLPGELLAAIKAAIA